MSPRKRRHLLVSSLLILPLTAVLIGQLPSCGNKLDRAPGHGEDLAGHTLPVQALAFGPDGATLTSAAFYTEGRTTGMEIIVWDMSASQPLVHRLEYPGAVRSLTFAPGGRRLAAVRAGTLLLEDVEAKQERRLEQFRSLASALAFSADGAQLAVADFNKLTLWNVTGSPPKPCWTRHDDAASLAFAPGGKVVASGGVDGTIRLWDTATGQSQRGLRGHAAPVLAVACSPDGATLASADFRGTVNFWDLAALAERTTLSASGEEVSTLAFAPDGRTLAVAVHRVVQLWDVATGSRVAKLSGHEGKVQCLAFSPDGTHLATGGHDRTVRLWQMAHFTRRPPALSGTASWVKGCFRLE
jgi:WD40 repeat protein